MSTMANARCLIPCFAQIISRSTISTAAIIPRRINSDVNTIPLKRRFSYSIPKLKKETVAVQYESCDGQTKFSVQAKVGDSLLDAVVDNDLDLDGFGACEGTLACSTCHLIFGQGDYDKLPEEPSDEELDMLDLAYGITDTSRLGCQIIVTKDMEGLIVKVPSGIADARGPS